MAPVERIVSNNDSAQIPESLAAASEVQAAIPAETESHFGSRILADRKSVV